jgi:hypothetical protein
MPAKGQTQIIQFALFFLIGLVIFLVVSGAFKGRVDFYGEDIATENRKLISTHFSALIANAVLTCKECESVSIRTKLQNTTVGKVTEVGVTNTYLSVISRPGREEYRSNVHNLLLSLVAAGGSGRSQETIILSYLKNQNILRIFQ